MSIPLRLLHIEDSESDAALIERLLSRSGYEVSSIRVEDESQLQSALAAQDWDVIICDYRLPQFDVLTALHVLHASRRDIPFIVVSGTIGELVAVELMKAGVHDYLMKDNLTRLAPAVERELKEARIRRQRLQAEEALRASEALLQGVISSALDAVIVMDIDGNVALWSHAAELMFGYASQEALGQPLHSLISPVRYQDSIARGMAAYKQSGKGPIIGQVRELTGCRKDGSEFPVELSVAPIRTEGALQTVGVVRDITSRKQNEEALRVSEQRWQYALEGAGDGVWDLKPQTGEAFFSHQWKAMLGYDDLDVGNTIEDLKDLVHPDDRALVEAAVFDHLEGRSPVLSSEHRVRCKDGSYKWILARGKIVSWDPGGNPLRVMGTHTDISPLKQAEQERENLRAQFLQAQKMESIGRLAGGVAHDFNNLLTVINGYCALLLNRPNHDPSALASLKEIHAAGERAAALVRQLLAFGRKQLLEAELVDLNEVVSGISKMLRLLIGEDVEIVTNLTPALPPVFVDRHQMEQVLMNLAINARDAMPRGGTLTIETSPHSLPDTAQNHHVRVSVRDTGTGMDEDTRRHLFEPFFTTKEPGKGTGLGLATVHGIVTQSGGQVSCDTAPGQGTAFHIVLPASSPRPRPVAPETAEPAAGSGTILLVEDQAEVRQFIALVLESYGYRVLTASGAEEALAHLGSETPDLLLTDLIMPKTNGRALAALSRAVQPNLKVMFMSGHSADTLTAHGDSLLNASFLQKPFTPQTLATRVRQILDTP